MKLKRIFALGLALAMTLSLAACGGGNTSGSQASSGGSASGGSSTAGATEISLWAFNIGGFTEASNWDSLIAAFNEQNPDIKVTVTPINYQDGDQKLTSAISGGSGPDIIFEGPERIVGNYARWTCPTSGLPMAAISPRASTPCLSWTASTTCTP